MLSKDLMFTSAESNLKSSQTVIVLSRRLSRKMVPRIMRWVLYLQDFNYTIQHRAGNRMSHVDALSRVVLIVEENSIEQTLQYKQDADAQLQVIRRSLEQQESAFYELNDGLLYRKHGDRILFVVPKSMENQILAKYHDQMGHFGVAKTLELIQRSYWFPKMKEKTRQYIADCLKCIVYSPHAKQGGGILHSIPKGNIPFDTIHVDHVGPYEKTRHGRKHILVIVDAFTKFVKLYPCKSVDCRETIKHILSYFRNYSCPKRLISDRGAAFTAHAFEDAMSEWNVQHVLIATGMYA